MYTRETFPKKWCVMVTKENLPIILNYFKTSKSKDITAIGRSFSHITEGNYAYYSGTWSSGTEPFSGSEGEVLVNFEDLNEYVLKQEEKVLGVVWFTNQFTIGIVLYYNGFEEKAYISKVKGEDIESDIKFIQYYGAKFPVKEAKSLISALGTTFSKHEDCGKIPIIKGLDTPF